MKAITERQSLQNRRNQWVWFVGLWAAGLSGAFLLGWMTKWFVILVLQ